MRRPLLLSFIGLCACVPSNGSDAAQQAELAKLRAQLQQAEQRIDELEAKLATTDATRDAKLEAIAKTIAKAEPREQPPPPRPAATGEPVTAEMLEAGIRCEADRCTCTRALWEALHDAPDPLSRSARLVPTTRDDQVVGFKLFAIRPGTIIALLGFEAGDLVTAIAGEQITGFDDALLAKLTGLRDASELEIAYERDGEARTLTVVIESAEAPAP